MSGDLSALVARLEAVTSRLEAAADKAGGRLRPPFVLALNAVVFGDLRPSTEQAARSHSAHSLLS